MLNDGQLLLPTQGQYSQCTTLHWWHQGQWSFNLFGATTLWNPSSCLSFRCQAISHSPSVSSVFPLTTGLKVHQWIPELMWDDLLSNWIWGIFFSAGWEQLRRFMCRLLRSSQCCSFSMSKVWKMCLVHRITWYLYWTEKRLKKWNSAYHDNETYHRTLSGCLR